MFWDSILDAFGFSSTSAATETIAADSVGFDPGAHAPAVVHPVPFDGAGAGSSSGFPVGKAIGAAALAWLIFGKKK